MSVIALARSRLPHPLIRALPVSTDVVAEAAEHSPHVAIERPTAANELRRGVDHFAVDVEGSVVAVQRRFVDAPSPGEGRHATPRILPRGRCSRRRSRRSRCADPAVHVADPRVHDDPILLFTMRRSWRSRCADPGVHDRPKHAVTVTHLHLPAVNTPQFEVVRNKLPKHAHPVPPLYQPEVIARAAVWAVLHPKRELWIGWSTIKAILGQRLIPGILDRYLARKAWESQQSDHLPLGHPSTHSDNVDSAPPGDRGAHGPFDEEARSSSIELWMRMNRSLLALGVMVLAFLGFTRRGGRGLKRALRT